jgi:hypothetical protein
MKLFRTTTLHPNYTLRCYPEVGERVPVIGCYSEASMHLGVSDKPIEIQLVYSLTLNGTPTNYVMCQIWKDRREYSFPVTTGEGGFYSDYTRARYYTYADESRLTPEQLASIQAPEEEQQWLESTIDNRPQSSLMA